MKLVIAVFFVLLAGRLVLVQGPEAHTYAAIGAAEVTATAKVPALRGAIYDRSGAVLAMSQPTQDIIADPLQVHHPGPEAAALARVLGASATTLHSQLSVHTGYVVLARQVPTATATKVMALHLPGITLQPDAKRIDPAGQLVLPVVGGVGAGGKGQAGLEYQYNGLLSGRSATATVHEAPSGVLLPGSSAPSPAARQGSSLELTIDQPLQYVAQQALGAEIRKTKAKSGIAIVMDVHTGAILAMVNLVNDPATGSIVAAPSNLAVTQVYEPGSVFKLVTFSAALQDGIITPSSRFTIPPYEVIDGATYHDAESHPTETLTATQILAQSSNLGTIQIAQRLGAARLSAQVAHLGFGRPTGLRFPGASPGIVLPTSQWNPTTIASTPIGEVDAVSAQQLLDMFNAVANGGVFVPPRLVRAVVTPAGAVHAVPRPRTHRVIPAAVDSTLTTMMEQVVTSGGTAPEAAIPGYRVAGKTGTSNVARLHHPGYVSGAFYATFAGFAPAQHPQLSALVMLKQPTTIYGGSTSAPVFAQIVGYALHRYGVAPSPGASATGTVAAIPFSPLNAPSRRPTASPSAGTIAATATTASGHP